MAVPSRTQTLSTFVTATAEQRRPGLIDNFFGSAPLWARILRRDSIRLRGGEIIKENFVYANMPGGSYGRGFEFDTQTKEFATAMVFNWKFNYAAVNLDVIDVDLNDSPEQVFDLVEGAMENGEMTLVDNLSTQLFGNGTGNGGLHLDGLTNAISQTGTYGGITRNATSGTPGFALRAGGEDSVGGVLSLTGMNAMFGNAVVGRRKPDLIPTTQTLWNAIWDRSQPSERSAGGEDMREIGFETVRLNGAAVTVDSHSPSGSIHYLDTTTWRLYIHRKWDYRFRGWMEPTNQQRQIGQLILWGNLICRSPRTQAVQRNMTSA